MLLELPCRTDLRHYTFAMALDGVTYRFTFRWNERAARWTMSIANGQGEPLLMGRRVVADFPLMARFRRLNLPPGELVAHDTSGVGIDPGLTDLGSRVRLYYVDRDTWPIARVP